MFNSQETIVALATPPGVGAIGVIRISGSEAFPIVNRLFKAKDLTKQASHTIHYGALYDEDKLLDEVVISLFKAPKSYTKEDIIEISCHGSSYILQEVLKVLLRNGAKLAAPGEFTQRAFLNGRFDLAQAEAVADLIAAESDVAQRTALKQMRGGVSNEIKMLKDQLIHFASLIELELDFAEEDVEFANREEFLILINKIIIVCKELVGSFALGNAIKDGISVVIAGKPNTGKSTLLNALLNEEKAIVSNIPGTTRDFIEDRMVMDGYVFRFTDTAGIRIAEDQIEMEGVNRTLKKLSASDLILYLVDLSNEAKNSIQHQIKEMKQYSVPYLIIGNKIDNAQPNLIDMIHEQGGITISAKKKINLSHLKSRIKELSSLKSGSDIIITNVRHHESLIKTMEVLERIINGVKMEISNDLVAQDIRMALFYLGEITGEVMTEDILDNIF